MNKPPKPPRSSLLGFLSPAAGSYDQNRPYRIFFFCLVIGIAVAVAFGFTLYYLNKNHRI